MPETNNIKFRMICVKVKFKKSIFITVASCSNENVSFKWEGPIAPSLALFPLFYGVRKEASRKLSCEWKISIEQDTTVPLEFFTNFAMVYNKECSYLFWISIEDNSLRTWCLFCFDFPPQMFESHLVTRIDPKFWSCKFV